MDTNVTTFYSSKRVFDDENLLTEILLRIPAKHLPKLKLACKKWHSIVSSDLYARIHTLNHPPNSDPTSGVFLRRTLLIADSDSPTYCYHSLSLPFGSISPTPFQFQCGPSFASPKLLQSCNGLLLLTEPRRDCYCVYNPATCQFKTIPKLILGESARALGVSLAFDPSRFEGFRVVCVATTETSAYTYRVFSYGSSDRCWNQNGNPFIAPFDVVFSSGIYWNGGVHWISLSEDSVYFDVETEKLGKFPSPPMSPRNRGYKQLCELNGNLHYVDGDDYRSPVYKIYALLSYAEGWVLRYKVDVPDMGIQEESRFSMLCLVCREESDERRLEMVVNMRRKILAYDLEKKTWRSVCGLESVRNASSNRLQFGWFDAYAYTATLALF